LIFGGNGVKLKKIGSLANRREGLSKKTFENYSYFRDDKCCLMLLGELEFYRKRLAFKVLGYVIMPDHLHCLIFWDAEEYPKLTISKIMQGIKSHSAKEILCYLRTGRRKPSLSPYSKGASKGSHLPNAYEWENIGRVHTKPETRIWQKGFYDFNIYNEEKFYKKLNYIHNNPVSAGLCENPEDYQWSSYHQIMGINEVYTLVVARAANPVT